jgi:hypothetical protein
MNKYKYVGPDCKILTIDGQSVMPKKMNDDMIDDIINRRPKFKEFWKVLDKTIILDSSDKSKEKKS